VEVIQRGCLDEGLEEVLEGRGESDSFSSANGSSSSESSSWTSTEDT